MTVNIPMKSLNYGFTRHRFHASLKSQSNHFLMFVFTVKPLRQKHEA